MQMTPKALQWTYLDSDHFKVACVQRCAFHTTARVCFHKVKSKGRESAGSPKMNGEWQMALI